MSNLTTLPKGDSAWLLRKAIQRVAQQINTLETNVNPAATGGSLNTQVLFNDAGAVKGDPDFTYNKTTDTLTATNGQFTNLNASGNVALGNLTVSGTFTALGGENASAVRAAASDYAAVTFDGATASTRVAAPCQALGTGDFSLWSRIRVPATGFTAGQFPGILSLSDVNTTASRTNGFRILFSDTGSLQVSRFGATTSDIRTATISGFRAAYSGQVIDINVTRAGATLKIYINGTDTAYTETTAGTAPAWSDTIVSDFVLVGCSSSAASNVFVGRIYRSVVFNRALSASDVTELITTGVNPADQWGTQTQIIGYSPAVLNGGFETNSLNAAGTWGAAGSGTSTATIDTSGSFSRTGTNAGKFTLDGSGSFASFTANNNSSTLLTPNKRYRLSFWARKGATSGTCGVQWGSSFGAGAYGNTGLTLTTTYAQTVAEVVVLDGSINLSRYAGSAGGSEIYIDDVELTRIGAIVDLDLTVGAGYQATDRSTNALHGTLFNGVEFTVPKRVAVLYATTTASGNTQLLGSLALPTNAIIEDIICNSSGAATVSIGNVSAGTQIVNGASVSSGRQKLTLATPFSTTGNLWVNSSAAVTLQFTILYTIAA